MVEKLLTDIKKFKISQRYQQSISIIDYSTILSRFNTFKLQDKLSLVGGVEGHCVRVQRRYNKRRYGRARPVSRPSFWAGATFCSLSIGMF